MASARGTSEISLAFIIGVSESASARRLIRLKIPGWSNGFPRIFLSLYVSLQMEGERAGARVRSLHFRLILAAAAATDLFPSAHFSPFFCLHYFSIVLLPIFVPCTEKNLIYSGGKRGKEWITCFGIHTWKFPIFPGRNKFFPWIFIFHHAEI